MGVERTVHAVYGVEIEPADSELPERLAERLWGKENLHAKLFVSFTTCGSYGGPKRVFLHAADYGGEIERGEAGLLRAGGKARRKMDKQLNRALRVLGLRTFDQPGWIVTHDES